MSLDNTKVNLVTTVDEAAEFARWLSERDRIAVDTETEGLAHNDKVRILQIADAETAWVFPIEMPNSWGGLITNLLSKYTGTIICHNLPFDYFKIANTLGIYLDQSKVEDTMLMARILEPTRSAALKNISGYYVDSRAPVMQDELDDAMRGGRHTWKSVPLTFEPYWFYAGLDSILTFRLDEILKPRIENEAPEAYKLELITALVCGEMEQTGVKIDVPFTETNHIQLLKYIDEVADWCQLNYDVSPGQNSKVVEVLEDLGIKFTKRTAKGTKCLDKEVLSQINHPLAEAVLTRRQAQKIASSYLSHFIEKVDENSRIHPNINSCVAKTGRMSISNPPLQQLPRKSENNKMAEMVRNCVIPSENRKLLMCDFEQIEFRIFASMTKSQDLIKIFESEDIFTDICRQIFNDETITRDDDRRQKTKNTVYSKLFGGGVEKIAWTAGISLDEAAQFNGLLDRRYPAIRKFQNHISYTAKDRLEAEGKAYVHSPLTRRKFVIDDSSTYVLVNYLCQGQAAEVLKMKLCELSAAGLGKYMIAPVHDEILLDVPETEFDDAKRTVYDIMNDKDLLLVPITASMSEGERWGSKINIQP